MNANIAINKTLDARQFTCPVPILETKKALASLKAGERLLILTTDPDTWVDFVVLSQQTGYPLLSRKKNTDGFYEFILEKN